MTRTNYATTMALSEGTMQMQMQIPRWAKKEAHENLSFAYMSWLNARAKEMSDAVIPTF